ncbi:NAD(P)H-binding protein [Pseudonocardia acaciae]|uniref:NAD(P)H-binding protein n=1 Tax=Pseudonocardia acaciae TaxID=551276 RepID=UPI00048E1605|nr:NAD(P)H-binding protein [Pseudonocardia acaciae]
MILVTGATGHVGAELVRQLAAAGTSPIRAMTRRPESIDPPPGVEVVKGDADDPAGLHHAFAGVERAFLMSAQPTGPRGERPTHLPRLVDAAARAGVAHVVALSVFSGGEGDDAIAEWCGHIEDAVTGSGMGWTLLRPGRFMSNALHLARQIHHGDQVTIPFANRPAASIDPADIAAVAALALTTDGHHGAAYQLSGPEVLTPTEELAILAELLGRPLRAIDPPLDTVRAGMLRGGVPEDVFDAMVARTVGSDVGTELLPTVAELLGRPPTTFARWARAHLDHFRTEGKPAHV